MIQVGTDLKVVDNTGAKRVRCVKILGGNKKRYARIGEVVTVAVKEAIPGAQVKKKSLEKALIVRQKKEFARPDGTYVRFDDNAVVLVDAKNPKGTRVFGPVAREIRQAGYQKIVSLAPEVL